VDASVWVAAQFRAEPHHAASVDCLSRALLEEEEITLPWLAWVECVAAIARKTSNPPLAKREGSKLVGLTNIRWLGLDEQLAADAADIAATHRLRSADSIYVAVAQRTSATFVTLDAEVHHRCSGVVACVFPAEWR
jgi:predicted nucleic acid-binding protein